MLSGSAVKGRRHRARFRALPRGGEERGTLSGEELIRRRCPVHAWPKVCRSVYIWMLMTVFRVARRRDLIHTFGTWRCGGSFHSATHAEARRWWYVIEPVAH